MVRARADWEPRSIVILAAKERILASPTRRALGLGTRACCASGLTTASQTAPAMATASGETVTHAAKTATDWSHLPGGVVDGGELILLAVKPSLWRPLFDSAIWIATCAVLAFAVSRAGRPIPGFSMSATVQLIVFVGFLRLGWAISRWIPRWFVLTNRRIMDIEGIREPRIWSCPLIETRNTYLNATPAERITGLGTISIVTEHADQPPRFWQSIAKAEEVHAAMRRAIENAIDQFGIDGHRD